MIRAVSETSRGRLGRFSMARYPGVPGLIHNLCATRDVEPPFKTRQGTSCACPGKRGRRGRGEGREDTKTARGDNHHAGGALKGAFFLA